MADSIYSSFLQAKTGEAIPVLQNGKTLESRYNPQMDAEKKLQNITVNSSFFIIIGVSSGIFITRLLEKYPDSKCIIIENTQADYNFLKQSQTIKNLLNDTRVVFSTQESIVQDILNTYIPSFYGNCQIIEQQAWITENKENAELLKLLISKSLDYVSKDFSVQAHFGKLWQDNILKNLKLLENNSMKFKIDIPHDKTALIVAAGPSLDKTIVEIKENRDKYYIISTDTAFSILYKNNIVSDCVYSIDAQGISYNHYIHDLSRCNDTLFIFDLTGNHSVAKKLIETNHKIYFTINQHPLSVYINNKTDYIFPQIQSGSGTVTIAAFDFAVQCGFKNLKVIGADFSYLDSKPYAKGTYLDSVYSVNSSRINTTEKAYSNLMYRIPVERISAHKITTAVLKGYEMSFIEYLKQIKADYNKIDNCYEILLKNNIQTLDFKHQKIPEQKIIFNDFADKNLDFKNKNNINSLKNTDICLLPLISWLRNNENIVEVNFSELLKIAYSIILRSFSL